MTETPSSDMNPMAAEMLNGSPVTSSARMPPATANGMPASASKRVARRVEQAVEQDQDQAETDGHEHQKALLGILQILELARP